MQNTNTYRENANPSAKIEWIDALKAFAIMGILLNHFVEAFFPSAWFTNPFDNFPSFTEGLRLFLPHHKNWAVSVFQFFGWLGDSGPGVFILLSGFTLMLSVLKTGIDDFSIGKFYKNRFLRIFPLFIVAHLLILGVFIFVPETKYEVSSIKTLLSLLGLRFTNELFFYINPSWWFVWLIIQLYIIFPMLVWLFRRVGVVWFLIITFSITFISRLAGITGYDVNHNLYNWMTGLFGATRLAEFSLGMGLAFWYKNSNSSALLTLSKTKIGLYAISLYIVGLLCSIWYPATIFSNLLVTIGLAGIFYALWEFIRKMPSIGGFRQAFLWVGVNSYAIFLVHQAFLNWSVRLLPDKMTVAALMLLISIPVSWSINKFVETGTAKIKTLTHSHSITMLISFLCAINVAYLFYFEPDIKNFELHQILALLTIILNLVICFLTYRNRETQSPFLMSLFYCVAFTSLLTVFLAKHYGFIVLALVLIFALLQNLFTRLFTLKQASLFSTIIIATGWLASESFFLKYQPLETGKWGEYAALEMHPTRVYSLKPNKETHLKYNNYDYVLRTNSIGTVGPEIPNVKDTSYFRILVIGDAFTMPEGLEYSLSYPFLLEKNLTRLDPALKLQVINGGVTGYGPVEEYPAMQELGHLLKPKVIIYQFFINEFEEVNYSPEGRLRNIGFKKPENLNFVSKKVYSSQVLLHLSRLYNTLSQYIKPGTNEYAYWKALLQFYDKRNNSIYNPETIKRIASYLRKMKTTADTLHAKFVVCFVPGAVSVSQKKDIDYFPRNVNLEKDTSFNLLQPYNTLQKICDTLQIALIDLTPKLKTYPLQPVYFEKSWHWNQEGHLAVADTLTSYIFTKKLVDNKSNARNKTIVFDLKKQLNSKEK